jgi:hypothetical protein
MKRAMNVTGLGLLILFLAACDTPVGLGARVPLKGPVLQITGPLPESGEANIAVNDLFELKGTVSGEASIVRMEIKMARSNNADGLVPMGREWRYNGYWQYIGR